MYQWTDSMGWKRVTLNAPFAMAGEVKHVCKLLLKKTDNVMAKRKKDFILKHFTKKIINRPT